ncbi:MAG: ArsA family ATPase [Myxococcales bacterium]|nr:ArsA family ATPase [Myxococcales bacterium]
MTSFDRAQQRFLFITGKGGVGKTTVTAALALKLAAQGKRVLIGICDAKERISSLLGVPPIGEDIVSIQDNVWAVKITAEKAMAEYGLMILKSRTAYKAVFDNKYTRGFFKGVPGLQEWSMLGKAWYHSIEELPNGEQRFDIVLFDAPATGHGLDMLRVPKVITEVVPPGILRRDADRAWKMFQDPEQSGVVVVTLPEDMPTNETIELFEALETELKLPVARLIINGVIDELFSEREREILLGDHDLDRSKPGDEAISGGVRRAIRERVQADSLERLEQLEADRVRLPLLLKDAQTPEAIRELAELL